MTRAAAGFLVTLAALFGCEGDLSGAEKVSLYKSIEAGHTAELRKAFDNGVSPNLYYEDWGYLIVDAATAGNLDALKMLIRAGANVNAQGRGQTSALHISLLAGRCEQVLLLLATGAEPKKKYTNAGHDTLGPEYQDKTPRELYVLYKERYPSLWSKSSSCWLEVEPLLK